MTTQYQPPRPTSIHEPHAVERALERIFVGTYRNRYTHARRALVQAMERAVFLEGSWSPGDLDGLGQGIWYDRDLDLRMVVDGNGLVRTVLS